MHNYPSVFHFSLQCIPLPFSPMLSFPLLLILNHDKRKQINLNINLYNDNNNSLISNFWSRGHTRLATIVREKYNCMYFYTIGWVHLELHFNLK